MAARKAVRFNDRPDGVVTEWRPLVSSLKMRAVGHQLGSGSLAPCRWPVSVPARFCGADRPAAGVRLHLEPLGQFRVVRLERRPLGADPRHDGEVVPRRRAGGGPLQRVAVAPRVVGGDDLAVPVGLVDVQRNGRVEMPSRNAPIVETVFSVVNPSLGR